jgi:hypothetical protein
MLQYVVRHSWDPSDYKTLPTSRNRIKDLISLAKEESKAEEKRETKMIPPDQGEGTRSAR